MLHKISIPAQNPKQAARVLSALLDGRAMELPSLPGAYAILQDDPAGTVLEIIPAGSQLVPGVQSHPARLQSGPAQPFVATHLTLSVARSQQQVLEFAHTAGWRAIPASRGTHNVVEVWLENSVLIEVLTPELQPAYLAAFAASSRGAAPAKHSDDRSTQRLRIVDPSKD